MDRVPASDKSRDAGRAAMPCFPLRTFLPMKQSLLLIHAFFVVSASLSLGVSALANQVADRPLNHTESLNESTTNANAKPHVIQKRANNKVQAAYFTNWYVMCCPESLRSSY